MSFYDFQFDIFGMSRPLCREHLGLQITHELTVFNPKDIYKTAQTRQQIQIFHEMHFLKTTLNLDWFNLHDFIMIVWNPSSKKLLTVKHRFEKDFVFFKKSWFLPIIPLYGSVYFVSKPRRSRGANVSTHPSGDNCRNGIPNGKWFYVK